MSEQERGLPTVSRRNYLGLLGAATASTTIVGTASSAGDYSTVVDIVEAGADNSGSEPIDDIFQDEAGDDTLIKFPEGTYKVNHLSLYGLTNFAMVGENQSDVTLVADEDANQDLWIGGSEVRNLRIENFTFDNTADGVGPRVDITASDGLVLRNIHKKGFHNGKETAFAVNIYDSSGSGLIENLSAPDGGTTSCPGIYLNSKGEVTLRNCRLENWGNNGLYGAHSEGPIKVEGGTYRNNNIAGVRLGSPGSYVKDALIVVDEHPEDFVNMRGVRISDGPGPVTVENCDIIMEAGQGSGGVVGAYSGGSFDVVDTRIHVGPDYTSTGSGGTRTSPAIFVDNPTGGVEAGERTITNTSITGGGRHYGTILLRRDNNTVKDVCITQDGGSNRDGVALHDSSNNEVVKSNVDVPGEIVGMYGNSSAVMSGNSDEADCTAPSEDGSSSSDSSGSEESTENSAEQTEEQQSSDDGQQSSGDGQQSSGDDSESASEGLDDSESQGPATEGSSGDASGSDSEDTSTSGDTNSGSSDSGSSGSGSSSSGSTDSGPNSGSSSSSSSSSGSTDSGPNSGSSSSSSSGSGSSSSGSSSSGSSGSGSTQQSGGSSSNEDSCPYR